MSDASNWSTLCHAVETAWPPDRFRDVGVVVGCSGGADSVALLRALRQLAGSNADGFFVAAHFNHGLRGESTEDERFVERLASELGMRFVVERDAGDRRDEDTARRQRRRFYGETARRTGARYIALGHSLEDNVETVLHRLMRGTGPSGLTGIAPFSPLGEHPSESDFVIARPLLGVHRGTIRAALQERDQAWREDSSNATNDYTRNWIRNDLLPTMASQFADPVAAVARAIQGQRQWADCLEALSTRWLQTHLIAESPFTLQTIDMEASNDDPTLRGQAVVVEAVKRCWIRFGWPLQSMGKPQWDSIYQMLCGKGPDILNLPGNVVVRRQAGRLSFARTR
ncbi:MAG: tRNA lysidine(34) synthetase TilS [Planctomycetota bacterium]